MIHIVKGAPLGDFTDFVQNEHPTNWDDIHHSKRHPGLGKKCREHILLNEQNVLGGYTERPLWNTQTDLHIDHFKKKGMNWPQDVTWEWDNFIVEDRNPNYGACYKDTHTSDMADYDLLLNPVSEHPERLMTYLPDGQIMARTDIDKQDSKRATFTIERFNLGHESLRQMRYEIMKQIESYNQLTDDEIRVALESQGFPSVVEWALQVRAIL